ARGRLRNPSRVPCASLPALRPTSPVRARRPSPATRHRAPCPSLSALRTLVPEPRAKPGAPPKIPPFSPFRYNLIRYTFQRILLYLKSFTPEYTVSSHREPIVSGGPMSLSNTLRLGAFVAVLAGAVSAGAAEYNIDAAHSDVQFRVRHMGISTVTGSFGEFSGTFNVDPKNVAATTGSAVIKVASINTNTERRDGHLKSDDFFNAEQFPEIKFTSKAV